MHAIRVTLPHADDRAALLALNGGDRLEAVLADDGTVLVTLPYAQSADAARAIVHTLRQGLVLDGERMRIGASDEV